MKFKLLLISVCSSFALFGVAANAAVGWTEWIDKDSPGGTSDAETLPAILQSGLYPNVCSSPSKIEAQYQASGVWRTITPETVSSAPNIIRFFNARDGLQCYNADQGTTRPQCMNYQVRFYCETDEVDLANKYPVLRQVDQENATYNATTPGYKGDKPIKLARVAQPAQTNTPAPPPPVVISDAFRLGQGYDSLANVFKNQCLNQNHPDYRVVSTPSSIGIGYSVKYTETTSELYNALDVREGINGKGTFVVDGQDLTVGLNYQHERIQSRYLDESHLVFVARYRNLKNHYVLETQPRPIKDSITATFLRNTNQINLQKEFHNECGDKYLKEIDVGASLYIVFTVDKKKLRSSDINDAKASVDAAIKNIFNVTVTSSQLNAAISTFTKYKVGIDAYQAGGPDGLGLTNLQTNPSLIPQILGRFENEVALTSAKIVAFNEIFNLYTAPAIYANSPFTSIFADTSTLALNAARWSALTGDFLAECNKNSELVATNPSLSLGICANKGSAVAVLAAGLKDCVNYPLWEKCVHPNVGGFDGNSYIIDRLSRDTPYYMTGTSTTPTVEKRFTKWWTCDYATQKQCLPVQCVEDRGPSVNGKGYDVNLYAWNTASGGSQNFNQDYFNESGQRCVKADARVCAGSSSGARVSFSLTTYHVCPSSRSFVVY